MTVEEYYKSDYEDYASICEGNTKYGWVASNVFDLATYDSSLDELFVKKIIEVCKVILDGLTYEYIHSNDNYIIYILVCQLLDKLNWIEWGTSIRGAWFQESEFKQYRSHPILNYYDPDNGHYDEIPFTINNLKKLIEFVEKEK